MNSTEPVRELAELEQLAKPALADARLVDLARDGNLTPNQARNRAGQLDVSRRQIKATKFLAMVCRDYGSEALEAYLTRMAQARADQTATTHVHQEKKTMTTAETRVLKNLELVADPQERLRLLLAKGYVVEAEAFLREQVEQKTSFLYLNQSGGEIARPLCEGEADPAITNVILVCHDHPCFEVRKYHHASEMELQISLAGLAAALRWDRETLIAFVRDVMQQSIANDPRRLRSGEGGATYWNVLGTTQAARHFLPDNDAVRKQVEIWQTRYHLHEGRISELHGIVMPPTDERYRLPANEADWLHWLVDRFLELGWSNDQIKTELVEWLSNHADQGLDNRAYMAIAKAKCFDHKDRQRIGEALHKRLPTYWENLREENCRYHISYFREFGNMGMYSEVDQEFFRCEFVDMLAKGEVGKVVRLLTDLGSSIGLRDASGQSSVKRRKIAAALNFLAPTAFDIALKACRYGLAAALGQHFDCVDVEALRRKASTILRGKVSEVVNLDEVLYCDDQDEFWHEVFDGTFEEPDGEDLLPTGMWYFNGPSGTDWVVQVTTEQKEQIEQLQLQRETKLAELTAKRREEIAGTVQLAVDLDQPIAFNVITLLK